MFKMISDVVLDVVLILLFTWYEYITEIYFDTFSFQKYKKTLMTPK